MMGMKLGALVLGGILMGCTGHLGAPAASPQSEIKESAGEQVQAEKKGPDSEKLHSGFDINGKPATCPVIRADVSCTMVFTAGDQYANDCRSAGGNVMMCDCHVYLCSKKL